LIDHDYKEFQNFLRSDAPPPANLDRAVRDSILDSLNPPLPRSLAKQFAIQAIGSVATLTLCPQFGVSIFGSHGLMALFMKLGPEICFAICGATWIVGGHLLARYLLNFDERRVVAKSSWSVGVVLIVLSVIGFASFGELTLDIWFGSWVVGALLAVLTSWAVSLRSFARYATSIG
jgi:hypothetical protein